MKLTLMHFHVVTFFDRKNVKLQRWPSANKLVGPLGRRSFLAALVSTVVTDP